MEPQVKIIEKIQKLVALSASANEHEATLAMEKAHDMLAAHNLNMAEVAEHKPETQDPVGRSDWALKGDAPWVRSVLMSTSELYFCKMLRTPGRGRAPSTFHFVGTEANTKTAMLMGTYFIGTIKKLSRKGAKEGGSGYKTSFRNGAGFRLSSRIRQKVVERVQDSDGSGLPMVIEKHDQNNADFISAEWGKLSNGRKVSVRVNNARAYSAGTEAGNGIGLDGQIAGANNSTKRLQ